MYKLRYLFGYKRIIGGSHDGKNITYRYRYTPAWVFWEMLIPTVKVGRRDYKGIYVRYNNRFFEFFWKPLCDGYYDKDKVWHKSSRLQFITFEINKLRTFSSQSQADGSPNKGKNMTNETHTTGNIEVVRHFYVDADGNEVEIPFDLNSEGEASQAEAEVFVTEDAPDHAVTIH